VAVVRARAELEDRGVRCTPLHVTHAFHSGLVQPAADAVIAHFEKEGLPVEPLTIPMTSNVSGRWMANHSGGAAYWAEHIVSTVRFTENVAAVLDWQPTVILEVGPGRTLCSLVGKCLEGVEPAARPLVAQTMRHPKDNSLADSEVFLGMLGRLWTAGVDVDWNAFHTGERQLKVRSQLEIVKVFVFTLC